MVKTGYWSMVEFYTINQCLFTWFPWLSIDLQQLEMRNAFWVHLCDVQLRSQPKPKRHWELLMLFNVKFRVKARIPTSKKWSHLCPIVPIDLTNGFTATSNDLPSKQMPVPPQPSMIHPSSQNDYAQNPRARLGWQVMALPSWCPWAPWTIFGRRMVSISPGVGSNLVMAIRGPCHFQTINLWIMANFHCQLDLASARLFLMSVVDELTDRMSMAPQGFVVEWCGILFQWKEQKGPVHKHAEHCRSDQQGKWSHHWWSLHTPIGCLLKSTEHTWRYSCNPAAGNQFELGIHPRVDQHRATRAGNEL